MTTKTAEPATGYADATFADLLLALNIPVEEQNAKNNNYNNTQPLYAILRRIEFTPDDAYSQPDEKPDHRGRITVAFRPIPGRDAHFYTVQKRVVSILYRGGITSWDGVNEQEGQKIGYLFTNGEQISSFTPYAEAPMKEILPVVKACHELGITVNGL